MTTRRRSAASKATIPQGHRFARTSHVLATALVALVMAAGAGAASAATITVDASKQTAGNPHFWSEAFGTGKAKLALRGDWQTHYKIGNRELGAKRVRGHGLLNDEMGLYKGPGSYDWTNLDTYLKAISSANMRPIIELSFMPTALASNDDKSPPKDYDDWKNFIKAVVQHCVDKYGAEDVGKWYWEVWNEPDYAGLLEQHGHDRLLHAVRQHGRRPRLRDPQRPGRRASDEHDRTRSPPFSAHCKSANKRVTFVSSHVYPGGSNTGTSADAATLVSDNNTRVSAITGAGYTTANVKSFNTEWNSSYSGQGGNVGNATQSMDNHWNVGFILKGVKLLSDKNSGDTPPIEVFSYWVLTDVFDEDGGTDGIHMTQKANTPFG